MLHRQRQAVEAFDPLWLRVRYVVLIGLLLRRLEWIDFLGKLRLVHPDLVLLIKVIQIHRIPSLSRLHKLSAASRVFLLRQAHALLLSSQLILSEVRR